MLPILSKFSMIFHEINTTYITKLISRCLHNIFLRKRILPNFDIHIIVVSKIVKNITIFCDFSSMGVGWVLLRLFTKIWLSRYYCGVMHSHFTCCATY